MLFVKFFNYIKRKQSFVFIIQYLSILLTSCIISLLLSISFWKQNVNLLHTSFELVCIFIALASFIVIWLTHNTSSHSSRIIGFGFLAVAIFDILHTYYFSGLGLYPYNKNGISVWYWVIGRFCEAVVLFVSSSRLFRFRLNKWLSLIVTLCLALGISAFVFRYFHILPVLITGSGVTTQKKVIEYIIIIIFITSFLKILKKSSKRNQVTYKYISMAILVIIPAEICFTLYTSTASFYNIFGHVLKVVYYFYLFKGIFASVISYLLEVKRIDKARLKQSRNELKYIFDDLPNLKIQTNTILNSINNIVVILDNNLNIVTLNKAFSSCVEIDNDDVWGVNINELIKKIQLFVNGNSVTADIDNISENSYAEATLITPNGIKKNIIFHSNHILNNENKVIGYIIVASDITEYKKEQEKILNQEKLALVGQMGSGIVHETKNYLASIKGYCQLLLQRMDEQHLMNYVHRIEDIAESLNHVIVDFLSIAKPHETIMDICSLNEIIDTIRYMIDSPSFMKDVKINVILSDNDTDIKADESQIKQVILNMAKNGIEAMADIEDARLTIETRFNDTHKTMQLIISDNGNGIPKELLRKLGTPFFTTKETGTGLGLSVCYKIVKEHGGHIDVQSKIGAGTTFTISFPCADDI